jgi:hypothetical protein
LLLNDPDIMAALQTVYFVHENIHAVMSRTRAEIVTIQDQIIAERKSTL